MPSSRVGQGWIKVGDILSDTDSSNVYPTIIFQPSQSSLFVEEIPSPPPLHHEGDIIIEGVQSVEGSDRLAISDFRRRGDLACSDC